MRAVRYREFGGPEKLQIEQIPQPELDGESVLIQITRAGVSPPDDKVRRGVLPPTMRKPLPLVPGAREFFDEMSGATRTGSTRAPSGSMRNGWRDAPNAANVIAAWAEPYAWKEV